MKTSYSEYYRILDAALGRWWIGIGYYSPRKEAHGAIFIRGANGFPLHVASFI